MFVQKQIVKLNLKNLIQVHLVVDTNREIFIKKDVPRSQHNYTIGFALFSFLKLLRNIF